MKLSPPRVAPTIAVAGIFVLWGACSVDTSGIGAAGRGDAGVIGAADRPTTPDASGTGGSPMMASGGSPGPAGGSGGRAVPGSGGQVGTGGRVGTGGSASTGGSPGSGGNPITGSGGNQSTGGMTASGGAVGTGGVVASGGAVGETGGSRPGRGGAPGGGGAVGCGPATCPSGCCNGNNCVTGNRNNQRCGSGGLACSPCAKCFTCTAGACEVDPQSSWTVTCESASVTPLRGALPWDSILRSPGDGALPDPFCELRIDGSGQGQTMVLPDTLEPVWNEALSSDQNLSASDLMSTDTGWSVFVGDSDGSARSFQDICEVMPLPATADFVAGTMTFTNQQSCNRLTLGLTCNN